MSDDTPTVELPRCPSCGMPVLPGTCCQGCGAYVGEPSAACAEIEDQP